MPAEHNEFGQPVGQSLANWRAPSLPPRDVIDGRYCRLEPLDAARHAAQLYAANSLDTEGRSWTYLPYGPFDTFETYRAWVQEQSTKSAVQLYAIIDLSSENAVGVVGYLRPDPANGVIEIGHVNFSPLLQRTAAATEALYLLIEQIFSAGYRRCEWKCNALNAASRRAALRLGFQFEGVFRQLLVVKGRNRDTVWFSIVDHEWPALRQATQQWLAPENFDAQGRQKVSLSTLTAHIGAE